MRETHFEVTIQNGRPAIRGEIDLDSVRSIEPWLASLPTLLEVDFSGVTFFDSTGLLMVLEARRRNPHLRIVNPSKAVLRILEITETKDLVGG